MITQNAFAVPFICSKCGLTKDVFIDVQKNQVVLKISGFGESSYTLDPLQWTPVPEAITCPRCGGDFRSSKKEIITK